MPRMTLAILLPLALALFIGCGPQEQPVSGTPESDSAKASPPEPMLISPPKEDQPEAAKPSVEPREASPEAAPPAPKPAPLPKVAKKPPKPKEVKNLIDNGAFGRWPEDVRIPTDWAHGFGYPSEEKMPSVLERLADKKYTGGLAVKQTWKRSDGADSVFRQFGITVTGLKPNTRYGLRVRAHNQSDASVIVVPYAVIEDGEKVKRLTEGGVVVKPDPDFGEYASGFITGEQTTVRLAAAATANEEDAYPLTVVWDEWILFELGPEKAAQ